MEAYGLLGNLDVHSPKSFLKAHRTLMAGLMDALEASDKKGESTPFIEFMLESIHGALPEFIVDVEVPVQTADTRLQAAASRFGRGVFSRKDYVGHFETLSTATASRDLRSGVDQGSLVKSGERATSKYRLKARARSG